MNKVSQYIKNISKSVSYAAIETGKNMTPAITETINTNSDIFKTITANLREKKTLFERSSNQFETSKVYDAVDALKTSIYEDIRSGQFYNKERKTSAYSSAIAYDSGFDIDWDDIDGGFDFDLDDDIDLSKFEQSATVNAIEGTSRASSTLISESIARSAEYTVESQKKIFEFNSIQSMQFYSNINNHLNTINTNIGKLVELGSDTFLTHATNSTSYFRESTELIREGNSMFREFLEMERNRYEKENAKDEPSTRSSVIFDDVIRASGAMDTEQYLNSIKYKIDNKIAGITGMNSMFGEDSNLLMAAAGSPLEFIPKLLFSTILGPTLKGSIQELDKSASNVFATMISKINTMSKSNNPIFKTIGDIFGLNNRLDTDIDTSKYKKGEIKWDGKARQALVEVIPTYLSKMVSILSGQSEKVYDYSQGKFIEASGISDEYQRIINSSIDYSTSNIRNQMEELLYSTYKFDNKKDKDIINEDIDKFFKYFFEKGIFFDPNNKSYNDYSSMGLNSPANYDLISELFKATDTSTQLEYNREMLESRDRLERSIRTFENEGDSKFRYINNGFSIGEFAQDKGDTGVGSISLLNTKDNLNNNIFFYLRKITTTLLEGIKVFISDNPSTNINPNIYGPFGPTPLNRNTNLDNSTLNIKPTEEPNDNRYDRTSTGINDLSGRSSKKIKNDLKLQKEINKYIADNTEKEETFLDRKLRSNIYDKFKTTKEKMQNIASKPGEAIANVIDKVDQRIYRIMYGSDDDNNKTQGFISHMIQNLKNSFTNFDEWMNEKVFEPLSDKFESLRGTLGEKIASLFGLDEKFKSAKSKIKEFMFGSKDEDGNYIQTGLLSGLRDQIHSDVNSFKKFMFGKNSTLRKVYTLLLEYGYDTTRHNTIDQMSLISVIDNTIQKFRSTNKEENNVASNIKSIIASVNIDNIPQSINKIIDILKSAGYGDKNESVFGTLKSSIGKIKDSILNTSPNINKVFDKINVSNILDRDKYNRQSKKIDPAKFTALLSEINKYISEGSYEVKKTMIHKIGIAIGNINATTDEEISIKNDLNTIYKNGHSRINNMNQNEMVKEILSILNKVIPNSNISKIIDSINILNRNRKDKFERSTNNGKTIRRLSSNIISSNRINRDENANNIPDGSHKDGIDSVPYNDYKANLHEGEAVLTKSENTKYKKIKKYIQGNIKSFDEDTDDENSSIIEFLKNKMSKAKVKTKEDGEDKQYVQDLLDTFTGSNAREILDKIQSKGKSVGDGTLIENIVTDLKKMYSTMNRVLFGTDNIDEDEKKINDKFSTAMKDIMFNAKDLLPKMGSGALLGGALGILPGIVGGPLAWAAIGSAAALTKNSNSVREYLFGEEDENGNTSGGIIPKQIMDGIAKYAPDLKKFGVLGAAAGILPFTPFGLAGGLMLGGATAFAKNNTGVQDFLFGEAGLLGDGKGKKIADTAKKILPGGVMGALAGGLMLGGPLGLIGGAMLGSAGSFASTSESFKAKLFGNDDSKGILGAKGLDKFKEFLPKAAMGTLAAGALGPFGLLGSAVIGSTLSMVSVTDHFKDAIFGEEDKDGKRTGGFMGSAKNKINNFIDENIKKPFSESLDPIKKEMKLIGASIKDTIGGAINKVFEESFGLPLKELVHEKIVKPVTNMFQKVFSTFGKIIGGIISSPFKAMKMISDDLRIKHQLNGDDDYTEKAIAKDEEIEKEDNKLKDMVKKSSNNMRNKLKVIKAIKSNRNNNTENITDTEDQDSKNSIIKETTEKVAQGNMNKINLQLFGNDGLYGPDGKEENTDNINNNPEILKHVSIISKEVDGQLDGVGYNIETIKNILKKHIGSPDDEASGLAGERGNKRRRGPLGRFLDFIKNPLGSLQNFGKNLLFGEDGESGMLGWAVKGWKKAKEIITLPFKLFAKLGDGLKNTVKTIFSIGDKIKQAISFSVDVIKNTGKFMIEALSPVIDGIKTSISYVVGGLKKVGEGLVKMTKAIPNVLKSLYDFGTGVVRTTGKVLGAIGGKIRDTAGLGFNAIFKDKVKVTKTTKMEITGGHLDSIFNIGTVDVVSMVKEIKNNIDSKMDNVNFADSNNKTNIRPQPVESMPTEFGLLQYKLDARGNKVPVENKPYDLLMQDKEKRNKVFEDIKDLTSQNTENSEEMTQKMSLFDKLKGGGSGIIGIATKFMPLLALAIPFIPKLMDMFKSGLGKMGIDADKVNSKINDTVGADSNVFNHLKRGAVQSVVTGKSGVAKGARWGVKKVLGGAVEHGAEPMRKVVNIAKDSGIVTKITQGLQKFFTNPKLLAVIDKLVPEGGKKIMNSLSAKIGPKIAEKAGDVGAKRIAAGMASNVFVIAAVGLAVYDLTSGFADAERILQMSGDLPIKFKIAVGIAKAINNRITFGILPLKWLVSIIIKAIGNDKEEKSVKDGQNELKVQYQQYKKKQEQKGVKAEKIKSFDEFNASENTSLIGKAWNVVTGKNRKKKEAPKYGKGTVDNGFVSQRDSKFNKGSNRMYEEGCAPSTLSMLLNKIVGRNINPLNALNSAIPYQVQGGGVKPKYFTDMLGKHGIGSDVISMDKEYGSDASSSKFKNIISQLRNGNPVTLMGSSAKNNGVFGPSPHYILANKLNPDGTVQISDPERSGPTNTTLDKILPSTKLAIIAREKYGKGSNSVEDNYSDHKRSKLPEIQPMRNTSIRTNKTPDSKYGKGSVNEVDKSLIKIIIELLNKVVNNTSALNTIVEILSSLNLSDSQKKEINKSTSGNVNIISTGTNKNKEENSNSELMKLIKDLGDIVAN